MNLKRRVPVAPLAGGILVLTLAGLAQAGGTRSFRQTTARDFEEGEATASMILPTGAVVPGMKTGRVPLDAAFAWSAAVSPDGRTAYFGTGDQGRIFAVPSDSSGQTEAPARKVADLELAWVTAMVARADGSLLATGTPGGRIFSVNTQTGAATAIAKLPVQHVWALVHEARTGLTYAATGGEGRVYSIDKSGNVKVLWDPGDKHVVSLADAGGGNLLAGTSDEGILYHVRPDGRATALHDFDADEVRAIARTGNTTFVAVNDFDSSSEGSPLTTSVGTASKGTKIGAGGLAAALTGAARPTGGSKGKGAVYRIEDDGRVEAIFTLADGYLTGLLLDAAGGVYAAAGTQGKVYRVAADRTASLVADLPERQVLSMARAAGGGFLMGTGDVGGVYRVRPARSAEATYLSKVFDADVPATWGRLRWSGSRDVAFETRSGNTSKPDRSWSEWKKLDGSHHAGVEGEGRVISPVARYLQYRARFGGGQSSVLRETNLFYLPQNQRARILDVTATGSGAPAAKETSGGATTMAVHSPTLKIKWRVDNDDGDDLIYRVSYRQEGETVWRPLGGPDPLTRTELDWNTDSVPDGRYVLRVWASDEKAVAEDQAMTATFESNPVLVDNTKPIVMDLQGKLPVISGRAQDGASVLTRIEYSIDGGEWRPASPTDAILDQRVESFSFRLPPTLAPGPHVVTVRALDDADNIGTGRISVEVGRPAAR